MDKLFSGFAVALAAAQETPGGGEQHELPNFLTVVIELLGGNSAAEFLHRWENVIFSLIIIGVLVLFARAASRNPKMVPGGLQNVVELIVETLENFIVGVIGPRGRKFVPFLGTLFLYIYFMNIRGLIPLMKSPSASINTMPPQPPLSIPGWNSGASKSSGRPKPK